MNKRRCFWASEPANTMIIQFFGIHNIKIFLSWNMIKFWYRLQRGFAQDMWLNLTLILSTQLKWHWLLKTKSLERSLLKILLKQKKTFPNQGIRTARVIGLTWRLTTYLIIQRDPMYNVWYLIPCPAWGGLTGTSDVVFNEKKMTSHNKERLVNVYIYK